MANTQKVIACLYEFTGKKSLTDLPQLTIDNNNICFLQDSLFNHCSFKKEGCLSEQGKEIWWLTFFPHSDFKKICVVEFFATKNQFSSLPKEDVEKLATAVYSCQREDDFSAAAVENSEIIRGTKAVTLDQYHLSKACYEHVDGKGFSFLTMFPNQQGNFERSVILLALAQAYRLCIESLSNQLSNIQDFENLVELTKLHRQVSEFNARYFLFRPVKYSKTKLTEVWQQMFDALQIDEVNEELTKQVANIHHIIELQYSHKMQELEQQNQDIQKQMMEMDSKRNYLIGAIGIALALIELIF